MSAEETNNLRDEARRIMLDNQLVDGDMLQVGIATDLGKVVWLILTQAMICGNECDPHVMVGVIAEHGARHEMIQEILSNYFGVN